MPPPGALQTPGPAQRLQALQRAKAHWCPMPQPRGLVLGTDSRASLIRSPFPPPLCLAPPPTPVALSFLKPFPVNNAQHAEMLVSVALKKVLFGKGGGGLFTGLAQPHCGLQLETACRSGAGSAYTHTPEPLDPVPRQGACINTCRAPGSELGSAAPTAHV